MTLRPAIAISATAALVIGTLFVGWAYRSLLQSRVLSSTKITSPRGTEALERYAVNGIDQWLLIRGADKDAPILLFLHGGPGSPLMPIARAFDADLVRHFTVVHWDQRGAGKSFHPSMVLGSLSLDEMLQDTEEVACQVLRGFGQSKLVLAGHSWGTDLGTLAVQRSPQLFSAWVSISTDVRPAAAMVAWYEFVLNSARAMQRADAVSDLKELGPPPYQNLRDLSRLDRWLNEFGGVYHQPATRMKRWENTLASPDYSLIDLVRLPVGNVFSLNALWGAVQAVDLAAQVPRVEVPTFFLHGRHDRNTPGELVDRYFHLLEAPQGKSLFWFEGSGHLPQLEEPGKFQEILIEHVLPIARAAQQAAEADGRELAPCGPS